MKARTSHISDSISQAISEAPRAKSSTRRATFRKRLLAFIALFRLFLKRYRSIDFLFLRKEVWGLDEEAYLDSFPSPTSENATNATSQENQPPSEGTVPTNSPTELEPIGDLGYSGSTFFTTPNAKYLVKSLPRRFEHTFFTHDLFDPYCSHMKSNPTSLLVRITDLVYTPYATLGGIIGTAPTHHVVMENLLYGKSSTPSSSSSESQSQKKWETYDLKPESYFFPERDILDGALTSEATKAKLIDTFPSKLYLSQQNKDLLLDTLIKDTALLAENKAVDYSLFLIRVPITTSSSQPPSLSESDTANNPWRTGVPSTDGKWMYRTIVLDFFWAKHKFQPKTMTRLVKAFNFFARKGPMSITAEPGEYRERFLGMVREMIVVGAGEVEDS